MIPTLMRTDHVGFVVPDIDEAIRFFVDVLGAELLFELGPYSVQDGNTDEGWMYKQLRLHPKSRLKAALLALTPGLGLELYEIDAPDQQSDHVRPYDMGAGHLAFRVADFDAALDYLRQVDGVTIHGETQSPDDGHLAGMRWLHFETSWGLVLEIDEWPRSPYPDEAGKA
jgi:catechol 2,3-dioxygenase-like lactoylglutathione lyase family enzyme